MSLASLSDSECRTEQRPYHRAQSVRSTLSLSPRYTVLLDLRRGYRTGGAVARRVSAITVKRDHALLMHNELPLPAGPAAGGVTHAVTSAKRKHTTVCKDFNVSHHVGAPWTGAGGRP